MEGFVDCPFCGDTMVDLVDLKRHLESGQCREYEETPDEG